MTRPTRSSRPVSAVAPTGFTLIELTIAIGIIIVLMGLGMGVAGVVREAQRRSATTQVVGAIVLAMRAYRLESWHVPAVRDAAGRIVAAELELPLWDWNNDGIVDGRAETDVSRLAIAPVPADLASRMAGSGYAGLLGMTGFQAPRSFVHQPTGRMVDPWFVEGSPATGGNWLRIRRTPGAGGDAPWRVWSLGRDGTDATQDDLGSWR